MTVTAIPRVSVGSAQLAILQVCCCPATGSPAPPQDAGIQGTKQRTRVNCESANLPPDNPSADRVKVGMLNAHSASPRVVKGVGVKDLTGGRQDTATAERSGPGPAAARRAPPRSEHCKQLGQSFERWSQSTERKKTHSPCQRQFKNNSWKEENQGTEGSECWDFYFFPPFLSVLPSFSIM